MPDPRPEPLSLTLRQFLIALLMVFMLIAGTELVGGVLASRARADQDSRLRKIEAFQKAQLQFDQLLAEALFASRGTKVKLPSDTGS